MPPLNNEQLENEGKTSGRLRDRIKRALSFSATFAAAGGIILGVIEYNQRSRIIQARETMEQIDIWDNKGARDGYRALSRGVAAEVATLSEKEKSVARDEGGFAFDLLRRNVSRKILTNGKNVENLDKVVYFFTRLGLCVESELCDAKVARVFFDDTLHSFLMVFEPAMLELYAETQTTAVLELQKEFRKMADPGFDRTEEQCARSGHPTRWSIGNCPKSTEAP